MKKLGHQYLNSLMKRWLAAPEANDRWQIPARRGGAPRTVMRSLAGHLFSQGDNVFKVPRPS
jgi:hypothetical protein